MDRCTRFLGSQQEFKQNATTFALISRPPNFSLFFPMRGNIIVQ